MPFDPFVIYTAISVFGTVIGAATGCEWIAIKLKAANITNHDLQKALRAAYEDALNSINFAFRQKVGLLSRLGKNRLYKEITTSFNDQFLNPFITEKKLDPEELKLLALNCSSYCKLLSSSIDIVLPLTEVTEITIEDLLLTGRNLKGADDLLELNKRASTELIERIGLVEGIPNLFCDLLAYKGLLLGSVVFFFNENIKSNERVRSILMHSELQRIREEHDRQHHQWVTLVEESLKSQTESFNICLTPIRDNLHEVRSSLERMEAILAHNTEILQRIYDILCQDPGLSDKERKRLQAGLSKTFNLHDKYEFDETSPDGYGSVAVVYKAVHKSLHQVRALKVLKPEHRNNPEVVERFLREAIVLGSLNQTDIVKIYDAGGGGFDLDFYLDMEYIEGTALRKYIETQPFNIDGVIKLIRQLGTAMQKMHEAGIIHRDLNPRNIMVDKGGDLKVMDFGVAKIVGVEGLTRDGQVVGTYDYMAPEQAHGQRVDERADIYSFGVIVYELCTKRMPSTPLLPIRQYQIGVPQWLEDMVEKCLAQDRNNRYVSAGDVLLAIEAGQTATLPTATEPEKKIPPPVRGAVPIRGIGKAKVSRETVEQVVNPGNTSKPARTNLVNAVAKRVLMKTPIKYWVWILISITILGLLLSILMIIGYIKIDGLVTSANIGEYDRAINNYTKAIELNTKDATAYNNRGAAYVSQGEYDKAIADFNRAIELNPNIAEAYINRGLAYRNKDEYDKAIADCTRGIELNPNLAMAYNNRGTAYVSKGAYNQAFADFNRAIEIDPKNATAYNNRGFAYQETGDNGKAEADCTRAIELNPFLAGAYNNRGAAYVSQGEYNKAFADFNRAIELNPKDSTAYTNRGVAYNDKGEGDKAFADFNRAIELNPKNATAYNIRGTAYVSQGEYDKAFADFNRAIELNPKDAEAYNNRGSANNNKGEYDKAIADCTRAIELNPNLAMAYNNRGFAYNNKSEYDKAIADCTRAIELDPKLAAAYKNREFAYQKIGDNGKAEADFQKAKELQQNP